MKKFNAGEWVMIMLGASIALSIVMGVAGLIFKGSTAPNEGSVAIRTALIEVIKNIGIGLISLMAYKKSIKDDENKSQ